MIKFFRHIRRKLLTESKFSKYLLYAIGEILLVVIGILIALSVNNWNQNRKDDKILKEYLGKIKSHTFKDIRTLDSLSGFRKQTVTLCKKARTRILDKTEDEDVLLFAACGAAFIDYYFKPDIGGYEALKNSDYFGKINNTRLDSLLARYHMLVDEIHQNETSYNRYMENQESHLSTQFDRSLLLAAGFMHPDSLAIRATTQEEYFQVYAEYTALPSYRNVISLCAFQFDIMLLQYGQLTATGNLVIDEIDLLLNQ